MEPLVHWDHRLHAGICILLLCCRTGGYYFPKARGKRRMNKSPGAARSGRSRHGHRSQHLLATEPLHANDRHRLQSCECPSARAAAATAGKAGLSLPWEMGIYCPESGERGAAAAAEERRAQSHTRAQGTQSQRVPPTTAALPGQDCQDLPPRAGFGHSWSLQHRVRALEPGRRGGSITGII